MKRCSLNMLLLKKIKGFCLKTARNHLMYVLSEPLWIVSWRLKVEEMSWLVQVFCFIKLPSVSLGGGQSELSSNLTPAAVCVRLLIAVCSCKPPGLDFIWCGAFRFRDKWEWLAWRNGACSLARCHFVSANDDWLTLKSKRSGARLHMRQTRCSLLELVLYK